MSNNKEFMDRYTKKMDKSDIRTLIGMVFIPMVLLNASILDLVYYVKNYSNLTLSQMKIFLIVVLIASIVSLIFYIFPNDKYIDLYTAVIFSSTSIFSFVCSMKIFFDEVYEVYALILLIVSLLIYTILLYLIIENIKDKMKNGYRKAKINRNAIVAIIPLCIVIGRIISDSKIEALPLAIVTLLLAYLLIPTYSGFHKFYIKLTK